jgi:ribosomal protein S18 acetylase RimI-like enzyme
LSGTLLSPQLRRLSAADRRRIEEITRAVGVFREEETAVALEVFDEAVRNGPGNTYQMVGAEVEGRLAAWICWGPTPCTLGTYDLYWMAVDPTLHGTGIGTALLAEMERRLDGVARIVVIETAGRSDYLPTRRFYESRGYRAVATVPDFYAPGDDQVVYVKRVTSRESRV